jgi:hypothetical protein
MCAHPPEARRTRTVKVRGYVVTTHYCPLCWTEQQRVRRARMAGRIFGINEELARFARLPVLE